MISDTLAPPVADSLNIARVVDQTTVEGPGLRTAVWVQGCSIRCPGCFNPHLWTTHGGRSIEPELFGMELVETALTAGVEGVTVLGGEPFEQAGPLAHALVAIRNAGLSVMTFTGYVLEDLRRWSASRPDIGALLDATDLLVDGTFDESSLDPRRPWIGSTNQRFHFLTDRYGEADVEFADGLQIRVSATGSIETNGWATADQLDLLLDDLGRRQCPK